MQLAFGFPGLKLPAPCSRDRRRSFELASLLARSERRNRILAEDLAEARTLAERLREDLADLEAERDYLARELLAAGRRVPVDDVGPLPRGPGVRSTQALDGACR